MSESRGAASVTLDTTVEAAIHFLPQLATWRDEDVRALSRAVTDALLAEYGWGWLPTAPGHPTAFQIGTIECEAKS